MSNIECKRCVMDTSDPGIFFNEDGICNHCIEFDMHTTKRWFPNNEGAQKLSKIVEQIKKEGVGKDYDCIIGLSGGVDSSYLALKLKELNLNPLVVHVDAGWNSEEAVHNIERIIKFCGFDLYTDVMDWGDIKDLQLAYLKSGVANQDVVQDHAFFAALYKYAVKHGIKYVINGGNIATESVFPKDWHHSAMDAKNIKAIHKKFGTKNLVSYKLISFFDYYINFPYIKGMKVIRPLNFMEYNKENAIRYLQEMVGYKPYDRKHGESRFTKFFQNYYLPKKFKIDKRRAHLSSQILSGEITRNYAKDILSRPLYEEDELKLDKAFISKKLNISLEELEQYIEGDNNHYSAFDNWDIYYKSLLRLKTIMGKIGIKTKSYS